MILPYNANPGRMEFSERTGQEDIVLPIGRVGERGVLTLLRSDDEYGCILFHVESSETDLRLHSEF